MHYRSFSNPIHSCFEFKDWEAVHDYTSDSNVMKYIPERVFTEEDIRNFVNKNMDENARVFSAFLLLNVHNKETKIINNYYK